MPPRGSTEPSVGSVSPTDSLCEKLADSLAVGETGGAARLRAVPGPGASGMF